MKYAVFNPIDGKYSFAETKEAAISLSNDVIAQAVDRQLGKELVTAVEIHTDADGNETWVLVDLGA
jgi:hypothetical protein